MKRFKNAVERTHHLLEAEKREMLSDTESDGSDSESGHHFLRETFGSDDIKMWIELFSKYPSLQNISGLHIKLESASEKWMQNFLNQGGLETIIEMLHTLSTVRYSRDIGDLGDAVIFLACINCLKSVIRKNNGLEYLCQTCSPEVTQKIMICKSHVFTF